VSFICLAIGDFGYNRIALLGEDTVSLKYLLYYHNFYILAFGLVAIALIYHYKIYRENLFIIFCVLFISFLYFMLQKQYLLLDECPNGPSYFLCNISALMYSIIIALVFGISIFYCQRTLHVGEFVFLHLLMSFLNLDFTERYQVTQMIKNKSSLGAAGFLWTINLGAIFLVFLLSYIQGQIVFSKKGLLANLISIRTVFGLSVLVVLLMMIFFITNFLKVINAVDITFILNTILFCWSVSNILAFNISSTFMKIGTLMGTDRVNDIRIDGSPGVQLNKINKTIFFSSEMNFIVDQYNQMADKFNLRGKQLVESMSCVLSSTIKEQNM